jgi:hypothetical protein
MMPIPELKRSDAAAADPVFLGTAPGARIIWGLPTIAGCLAVPPKPRLPPRGASRFFVMSRRVDDSACSTNMSHRRRGRRK